jgi:spore coat protein H
MNRVEFLKGGRLSAALLLALLLWPAPSPTAAAASRSKKADPSDELFGGSQAPRIQIEIPAEATATLRKYRWQAGQPAERQDVRVTIREGGRVYNNVALHLKGAAGSFRAVDENPAMTLHFDKWVRKQRFHGLSKLSLNNSVQDPTLVSEELCRELFLKAGIPTPRATQAWVELNGRDLGVYVLTEGWDKRFLKRHFKNAEGNLYDGGFLEDVDAPLTLNSGDKHSAQTDRIALADAAREPDPDKRRARLEKVLDLDRFLTFVALEVMSWDWDGYAMNRNNWRLYHDLDQDRMMFMPHGMDQMFGNPTGSVLPPVQGLVAKAVLEIPDLRQRYFERMKELRAAVFQPAAMTNRAREIASKVTRLPREKEPRKARDQESAVSEFCDNIMARGRFLDQQLAHSIVPLKFDGNGFARLSCWESKRDFGAPSLRQSQQPAVLEIGAEQGSSIGSWRTNVWLEKGGYQLQGRIKTDGIVADPGDPRGGAGFRVDKRPPENYTLGSSDWKEAQYEFSVDDLLREVQIVCDFRGEEGKARFDLESLRLRRLPAKAHQ